MPLEFAHDYVRFSLTILIKDCLPYTLQRGKACATCVLIHAREAHCSLQNLNSAQTFVGRGGKEKGEGRAFKKALTSSARVIHGPISTESIRRYLLRWSAHGNSVLQFLPFSILNLAFPKQNFENEKGSFEVFFLNI